MAERDYTYMKVWTDGRAELRETLACGKITRPAAGSGCNGSMLIEHPVVPMYTLVTWHCHTVTRHW